MSEVFVISDTHFGHANILNFIHYDGMNLRPFHSVDEMNYTMVERWNDVVRPQDKVYHLGDAVFGKKNMFMLGLLNGKKRLVRGNHDLFPTKLYLEYFDEVYGVRQINGVWLTHVPMHLDCVSQERVKMNIHGHLHKNFIDHPKYFNASVERINYTPISIDEIIKEKL